MPKVPNRFIYTRRSVIHIRDAPLYTHVQPPEIQARIKRNSNEKTQLRIWEYVTSHFHKKWIYTIKNETPAAFNKTIWNSVFKANFNIPFDEHWQRRGGFLKNKRIKCTLHVEFHWSKMYSQIKWNHELFLLHISTYLKVILLNEFCIRQLEKHYRHYFVWYIARIHAKLQGILQIFTFHVPVLSIKIK